MRGKTQFMVVQTMDESDANVPGAQLRMDYFDRVMWQQGVAIFEGVRWRGTDEAFWNQAWQKGLR